MSVDEKCKWLWKVRQPRYVWFECNSQTILDEWKLVATEWQQLGTLIMTTQESVDGRVADFTQQALAVSGVNGIVTGFKTSTFWDFAGGDSPYDTSIWQAVRDIAVEAYNAGGNPIVLENESNLASLRDDWGTTLDPAQLQAAIEGVSGSWPEIWHWSSPTSTGDPTRQLSIDWATGVKAAIPNTRFIEDNSAGLKSNPNSPMRQLNVQVTSDLDSNPLSIVYLDNTTSNFWRLGYWWKTMEFARWPIVLYPGYGDLNNYALCQNGLEYVEELEFDLCSKLIHEGP